MVLISPPQHLVSPASLPFTDVVGGNGITGIPNSLSILSYNVLLPNSIDGWWNYKMYYPPLTPSDHHISTWEHRRSLLQKRISTIDSDVVCLQEISPSSFEDDFAFMSEELGYDGVELFKKGRFRPATFWKTERCELVAPPVHRDRTLLTTFRRRRLIRDEDDEGDGDDDLMDENRVNWHVLNCHLQAGKQPQRRLRQAVDGVSAVVKLAKRLKEIDPTSPNLIVCGDFNGDATCGAIRYLEDGIITPEFREDGQTVTSKIKTIPTSSPLADVAATTLLQRDPPPTLIVPELISLMVDPSSMMTIEDEDGGDDDANHHHPRLSHRVLERLERIYDKFATREWKGKKCMSCDDVERWLTLINGKVGRGSEFREAAKEMGWTPPPPEQPIEDESSSQTSSAEVVPSTTKTTNRPPIILPPDGILSLEGLKRVYESELYSGKFWGIAHDLAVLGEPLEDAGLYTARFDRMYCSASVRPTAILDTVCHVACPNDVEPSDHLPVAASFSLR